MYILCIFECLTLKILCFLQDELDSVDMSVVISSCSLTEARHLLDHFLKASIDKVSKLKLFNFYPLFLTIRKLKCINDPSGNETQ